MLGAGSGGPGWIIPSAAGRILQAEKGKAWSTWEVPSTAGLERVVMDTLLLLLSKILLLTKFH